MKADVYEYDGGDSLGYLRVERASSGDIPMLLITSGGWSVEPAYLYVDDVRRLREALDAWICSQKG